MKIFQKIRKYFNPTFEEWTSDFNKDLNKELKNPRVVELIKQIALKRGIV